MIESSFLCSSSWDCDLFQDFGSVAESSFVNLEEYASNFERTCENISCCATPNDASSSSSDYEAFTLDDLDSILPISDTFVSHILEESNSLGFDDLDWSSSSDSPKKCNLSVDNKTSLSKSTQKQTKKLIEYLPSSKKWSKMSSAEQLETLHVLSEIVTRHMGIREQIEVIKIIDPSAVISPDDKEFALDVTHMNDVKLKRIKHFIRKHGFSVHKGNLDHPHSVISEKSSKLGSKKASCSSHSRTKRRQRKQKELYCDEETRLKRKLELHGQKEAQSGLFVYEKVIKKLSNPSEEDEDVNILE